MSPIECFALVIGYAFMSFGGIYLLALFVERFLSKVLSRSRFSLMIIRLYIHWQIKKKRAWAKKFFSQTQLVKERPND